MIKEMKMTVPYAIIGVLAILNGSGTARAIYQAVKKEMKRRDRMDRSRSLQEGTFRTVLTRLKQQGLVENPSRGVWKATKKGLGVHTKANERENAYKEFVIEYGKKRDTIIIFDVPENKRKLRDYLRGELLALGYELLQKSVWIGGSPLPEQFMDSLKEKALLPSIHIFAIRKYGTVIA